MGAGFGAHGKPDVKLQCSGEPHFKSDAIASFCLGFAEQLVCSLKCRKSDGFAFAYRPLLYAARWASKARW